MCCGVHSSMGPILMRERRKESNMVSNSHLTHTHSHSHTHTHAHSHTHTHSLTHSHTRTLTHTHTHTHSHSHIHSHTHTHAHSHTRAHTLLSEACPPQPPVQSPCTPQHHAGNLHQHSHKLKEMHYASGWLTWCYSKIVCLDSSSSHRPWFDSCSSIVSY